MIVICAFSRFKTCDQRNNRHRLDPVFPSPTIPARRFPVSIRFLTPLFVSRFLTPLFVSRSPAALDPAEPEPHPGILPQHVQHHLSEQEPGQRAAFLGDRAQPLRDFSRVAAAGRQSPVIGQAARMLEAPDVADPTGQPQRRVGRGAGHRRDQPGHGVRLVSLEDLSLQLLELLPQQILPRRSVL